MEIDFRINESNQDLKHDQIEPINASTIHRICSGQVILSLAIAVKELIENAIDASATRIEIRLKEYGSELLEVLDNGTGVHSENFQALTLKHCTSKLHDFTDLTSIATLGFRGEALSSLCALSDLSIITRHASADYATKLNYDANGKIVDSIAAAREIGTTVVLENLFANLPVRRKEFLKNLKREYSKMCQLLYAYCLVSKGLKFTCSNFTNGVKNTVLYTEGSTSIRDNIVSIFGPKQMPSLIQLKISEPDEKILEEYKVKLVPGEPLPFSFDCFISNVIHGSGRSSNDRQFFYFNSRPCEPQKIMKLVNSIYKQFNGNQYPFVYLNINIQRSLVDVNVTPDKRQVFVDNEKLLLAVLKSSLLEAFKTFPSTYSLQNIGSKSSECDGKVLKRSLKGNISELLKKRFKSESVVMKDTLVSKYSQLPSIIQNKNINEYKLLSNIMKSNLSDVTLGKEERVANEKSLDELIQIADELEQRTQPDLELTQTQHTEINNTVHLEKSENLPKICIESLPSSKFNRQTVTVCSSIKSIKEALVKSCVHEDPTSQDISVNFHSQITPASNVTAEKELQKQITKDKFKEMSIIGQFNLGFIITQLENDLFIIDQHATDEKYNFELLQLNTSLDSQVLVNPKPLQLTAANEDLLIDNEEVFKKNGFGFLIERNAPATKKVSLTSIPMSKNYIFGKNDIEEMLFMLQEGINPAICRPSRVQLMFATRACRKSVMVGCPLGKSDMRRLVDHMGEIDQPWNCPHGRPTMRHLVNLKLLDNKV